MYIMHGNFFFSPKSFKSCGVSGWDIMCYSCKLEINQKQVLMKRYETEDKLLPPFVVVKGANIKHLSKTCSLIISEWIYCDLLQIIINSSLNYTELVLQKSRIFWAFPKAWCYSLSVWGIDLAGNPIWSLKNAQSICCSAKIPGKFLMTPCAEMDCYRKWRGLNLMVGNPCL